LFAVPPLPGVPGPERNVYATEEEVKQAAVEVGPVLPERRRGFSPEQWSVMRNVETFSQGHSNKRGPKLSVGMSCHAHVLEIDDFDTKPSIEFKP
jgi:hypothetical protein